MKKDSKINRLLSCNRLLKWIFRNSSIGYKSVQSDTTSVNSLSLLIDVNNGNLRVIENQFKDKSPANKSRFTRKKRKTARKAVDQQAGMFKGGNYRKKFTLKNDFIEQIDSKEDYLNRLWNPKCKRIDNACDTANLLKFDSNFDPFDIDQCKPAHQMKHKPSDIVNLLLGQRECSICQNELVELDTPLEIMPCHCIFHLYCCISSNLLWKKICPFCYTLFSKKQITAYAEKWKSRYWLS